MIYAKFRDFQSFLCKYDAFHAFSRHICRIIADVTATCETLQYGITWISRNTHESFAIGMQLRYKRSIYDVAVLTSDSQHGTVGRIELQDAQGLVLRPFLEAAVQLELHDPRRPGLTLRTSYTILEGCAASSRFAQRVVVRWQRPFAPLLLLRQHNARPFDDIVYTTASTPVPSNDPSDTCVDTHVRFLRKTCTCFILLFPSPFFLFLSHTLRTRASNHRTRKTTISPECVCLPRSVFFYTFNLRNENAIERLRSENRLRNN